MNDTDTKQKWAFDTQKLGTGKKHEHLEHAENFCTAYPYLRFCINDRSFYQYEQGVYKPVSNEDIEYLMITSPKADENKDLEQIKALTVSGRRQVLENMKVICKSNYNDYNNADYINFKNCLYNIKTHEREPHTGELLSTLQLPYDYDPDAQCPLWIKTLHDIFEDNQDKINVLQEFLGYCLTRSTKYEKALILVGEGQSGKSTIIEMFYGVLGGENISALSLKHFPNPVQIASILNKLANIVTEIPKNVGDYEDEFKKITSGEAVDVNDKFIKAYSAKPFCKLVFACNRLPNIKDRSSGVYRRMIVLDFDRQFTDNEANVDLKEQLKEESSGVFNWALQGLFRLETNRRFSITTDMKNRLKEIEQTNNPMKVFCDDMIEVDESPNAYIGKQELYAAYQRWMVDNSMQKQTFMYNNFCIEIKHQYKKLQPSEAPKRPVKNGKRQAVWMNIKIKEPQISNAEEVSWVE